MGVLMGLTGWHDAFAGTKIVRVAESITWEQWQADSVSSLNEDTGFPSVVEPPRIVSWKIALAIFLHLFFAMGYVILGAL
jgi:hypothetical protein